MPIYCNVLHESQQGAVNTSIGDIDLVICKGCTHIYNSTFDPKKMDYSVDYENSLHYSKVFSEYSESLAQSLVERFDLKKSNIVEIGCGKGDFLASICGKGDNIGYGFDRSFDFERLDQSPKSNINFYQEFYDSRYGDIPLDFLCCRHVLEHIQFPVQFIHDLAGVSPHLPSANIYFEVPNGLFTLRDFGIWDIIYEHCAYFTPLSLRASFELNNFDVGSLNESFSGQFLSMDAKMQPNYSSEKSKAPLTIDQTLRTQYINYADTFIENYSQLFLKWQEALQAMVSAGERTVIWGSGSKGVTFLNIFKSLNAIEYAVDLNPHKHNMFVPGAGQVVVPPSFLAEYQPDNVIVMNSIYKNEIAAQLADMGVKAKLLSV
jgi:hypothetical protein